MAVEAAINCEQVPGCNRNIDDYGQAKRMRDAKQVQGIYGPKDLHIC
jgi:hypothetical protein